MLIAAWLLAGCSGGGGDAGRAASSGSTNDQSLNSQFIHEPGPADVSTMEKGQQFSARPNFYYTTAADCDHPCVLAIYSLPRQVKGAAVNYVASVRPGESQYTDRPWPCEHYDAATAVTGPICADHTGPGDRVPVFCQVFLPDSVVQDSRPVASGWWNKVILPRDEVIQGKEQLEPVDPNGYFGWAPDIWMGNTGDHGIPCT